MVPSSTASVRFTFFALRRSRAGSRAAISAALAASGRRRARYTTASAPEVRTSVTIATGARLTMKSVNESSGRCVPIRMFGDPR